MQLLFNDSSALTRHLITIGTPYLLFYSLSTVTIGALQGIDKMKTIAGDAWRFIRLSYLLLRFCDMNIYAILYSNIPIWFPDVDLIRLLFYIGYEQEAKQTFLITRRNRR